jgi:alpha-glucoside transport system substrate-binding protein
LLRSRLGAGAPPDVALIAQPGTVAELAGKGALKPLNGAATDAVNANHSGSWKKLGTIDGKFSRAGVLAPGDWDEFVAVFRELGNHGIAAMAVPGGDGWTLTDWFENVYLRVGGADRYDKLVEHEIPWTDPTVVRPLKILGD